MSAYIGARGLEQLRGQLTDRDTAILRSVGEHRFLTARHLEALHFADHATDVSAARVCRRVLARQTRDQLLVRLARRVGGVRAGSASYVYALGSVGARLLGLGRRFTEPSELFLDHTLSIADAHVRLVAAARTGSLELVEIQIEPVSWRRFVGSGGAREVLRPDMYAVTASGEFEHLWFIEIDRGTESPAALARKLRAYETYWRSGREQAAHGVFPLVLWVAPDQNRVKRIEKVVASARHVNQSLFQVCLQHELSQAIAGGGA